MVRSNAATLMNSSMVTGNLEAYVTECSRRARQAARQLALCSGAAKNAWLSDAARRLVEQQESLLAANEQDIDAAPRFGLTAAQVDRLRLTPERIAAVAEGLRQIAQLPDPVGRIVESNVRPNGLLVTKVTVPLGVIFFIYESRPNVTVDAAGLCVKSGNAVILRGGKEAIHSNRALFRILAEALASHGLPQYAVQLVDTTDREAVGLFLKQSGDIDLVIPRGGEGLIRRVVAEAAMPVLKHYKGNCHVFVDGDVDLQRASAIVVNSKCQRPGTCNAAETLLVHAAVAEEFLPRVARQLQEREVELRGCSKTREVLPGIAPATEEDFETEFLDRILAVRVVASLDEAIEHIARYGSGHTEAIVTRNLDSARQFAASVDAAAVMINASTRFHDGFEFGKGAEIGISTDKFHARGPCGLEELCTYKYVVHGDGQLRG